MKRKSAVLLLIVLFFLFIVDLCFKWDINILNLGDRNVEVNYYKSIEVDNADNTPDWMIIKTREGLSNNNNYWGMNLEELKDVNFDENSIVLSMGRKVNKIMYRENHYLPSLFYTDLGIAYFGEEFYANTVFVYLIDAKEKVFIDRRYNPGYQYVIE